MKGHANKFNGGPGLYNDDFDVFDAHPGSVFVRNAQKRMEGDYKCIFEYTRPNEAKHQQTTNDKVLHFSEEESVVDYFYANNTFAINQPFWLNCSIALLTGQSLLNISLEKDHQLFYFFSPPQLAGSQRKNSKIVSFISFNLMFLISLFSYSD